VLLFLLTNVNENPSGNSYFNIPIPIVAALIGAISALFVQGFVWLIKTRHEKKEKSRELLSEIFSDSYLLSKYYKELVMHKVHKHYWFKASQLSPEGKYQNIYYNNHLLSNKDAFAVDSKISQTFAHYTKVVRKYLLLNGKNKKVDSLLNAYQNYEPRKPSEFDEIAYPKLSEFEIQEEKALNQEYSQYGEFLSVINKLLEEMI